MVPRRLTGLLILALVAMPRPLFADTARPSHDAVHRLAVGGRVRTYRVHSPPRTDPLRALPVVLVLHGDKSSANRIRRVSRFDDTADAGGFLAVYPNGTGWMDVPLRSWNAGTCCGYAMNAHVDDVAFFRALLDDVAHRDPVDSRRVYVTGMSNGGMMAYRLACELSDRVAAVAVVAGAMTSSACSPSGPVSVMVMHGTDDAYVPYRGGRSAFTGDERIDPSVEDAVSFWTRHNGCPRQPDTVRVGHAVRTRYTGCRDDTEVVLYTIEGGPHRWPGRRGDAGELPTTELIGEFFSRHPAR